MGTAMAVPPDGNDVVGGKAGFVGVEIGDDDRSAFTRKGFGGAVADADRASGDEDDLVDEAMVAVHAVGLLAVSAGFCWGEDTRGRTPDARVVS